MRDSKFVLVEVEHDWVIDTFILHIRENHVELRYRDPRYIK